MNIQSQVFRQLFVDTQQNKVPFLLNRILKSLKYKTNSLFYLSICKVYITFVTNIKKVEL